MGLQTSTIPYIDPPWPHYFLCNYLPVSAARDTLSRSLLRFKHGLQPDLDGWIDCAVELLAPLNFPAGTIIVRALHHNETVVQGQSMPAAMDKLGKALAATFHCIYQPELLSKARTTRPNKGLTRFERFTELKNVYTAAQAIHPIPAIAPRPPDPNQPFLIIDDILTSGTTARMIIRAIRHAWPDATFSVFSLARADHDTTLNFSAPLRGAQYELEQGTGWHLAEGACGYGSPRLPYPWSGKKLKEMILTNSF
jgi:predicted amidophosphoribosyltransferase